MKKLIVLTLILAIIPFFTESQKAEKKKNSPDEKITVKREYDNNGNLTRFDSLRVYSWSSDSSFQFPLDRGWQDFFKGFGDEKSDSAFSRNFFFHNDTSFFMGPHSSMLLPPGFIAPDWKGMQDLEKLFRDHFKSFSPDEFFNNTVPDEPFGKFMDPRQQDEWNKMIQRQQKEQEEFIKKWNGQKSNKKIEKM